MSNEAMALTLGPVGPRGPCGPLTPMAPCGKRHKMCKKKKNQFNIRHPATEKNILQKHNNKPKLFIWYQFTM